MCRFSNDDFNMGSCCVLVTAIIRLHSLVVLMLRRRGRLAEVCHLSIAAYWNFYASSRRLLNDLCLCRSCCYIVNARLLLVVFLYMPSIHLVLCKCTQVSV